MGEKLTADEIEAWNERAGILEYCAGFSRFEADRMARAMVLQGRAAVSSGSSVGAGAAADRAAIGRVSGGRR